MQLHRLAITSFTGLLLLVPALTQSAHAQTYLDSFDNIEGLGVPDPICSADPIALWAGECNGALNASMGTTQGGLSQQVVLGGNRTTSVEGCIDEDCGLVKAKIDLDGRLVYNAERNRGTMTLQYGWTLQNPVTLDLTDGGWATAFIVPYKKISGRGSVILTITVSQGSNVASKKVKLRRSKNYKIKYSDISTTIDFSQVDNVTFEFKATFRNRTYRIAYLKLTC